WKDAAASRPRFRSLERVSGTEAETSGGTDAEGVCRVRHGEDGAAGELRVGREEVFDGGGHGGPALVVGGEVDRARLDETDQARAVEGLLMTEGPDLGIGEAGAEEAGFGGLLRGGLAERGADDAAECRDPVDGLVADVPDGGEVATGAHEAVELRQGPLAVEPVEGLPCGDGVDRAVGQGKALGGPAVAAGQAGA